MSGPTRPAVKAGQTYAKIMAIRAQCEQELAAYPESIRRKFAEREQREMDKLDAEGRTLLDRMLGVVADGSADK